VPPVQWNLLHGLPVDDLPDRHGLRLDLWCAAVHLDYLAGRYQSKLRIHRNRLIHLKRHIFYGI
jgi:hypothetical protein